MAMVPAAVPSVAVRPRLLETSATSLSALISAEPREVTSAKDAAEAVGPATA